MTSNGRQTQSGHQARQAPQEEQEIEKQVRLSQQQRWYTADLIFQEMTMADPPEIEQCIVCKKPESLHGGLRHTFTPPGHRVDTSQFVRRDEPTNDATRHMGNAPVVVQQTAQTPFDPVLRMALIQKGIITPEDLDAASQQIAVFTQAVTNGGARGAVQGKPRSMG